MKKNLERSPRSRITAAIRQLWLRSRERAAALRRDGYTCTKCGKKQSKAKGKEQKVEVHHIDGIKWDEIVEYIRSNVLVEPKKLETLCPDCHKAETEKQRK